MYIYIYDVDMVEIARMAIHCQKLFVVLPLSASESLRERLFPFHPQFVKYQNKHVSPFRLLMSEDVRAGLPQAPNKFACVCM